MPRPYRSRLRAEQADETRRRIRQSARELFATHGFSQTTIAQIAEGAGVAPQTVYSAYQSKGGVVRAMLEDLEESADQAGWEARIRAEPHPHRQLGLFVTWICTLFEVGAPILRASIPAMGDPDVSEFHARGDANRLGGATALTQHWAQIGALRRGLDPTDAAHRLWLLTSPQQFLLAIDVLGWTPDAYAGWLTETLQRELLAPGAED
ncbi:MAG TPA: TetR/AcrR family transcriptional regulator [Acidimicrobiia bacterium]|nr:TetR/AcrR family transcriptional regulator [Acidimicrobiia bacterium]